MDQTQSSRKNELKAKAAALLKQARYVSPMNMYAFNAAIESSETTEVELEELCKILEEHNAKYEQIFVEYKKEIDAAMTEYFQSMAKKNPPAASQNPPASPAKVQFGSADASKQ